MKQIKNQISAKDGAGMVMLRPETSEDLWHAYNLLRVGDRLRCTTVRKIVKESTTGSTSSSKRRLMLTVNVEKVDFDVDVLQVRVSGQVSAENDTVKLGAYHTLTLELHQNFALEKDRWDQIFLDVIEDAIHPEKQAQVAAIVMQPGLAHVCLVTGPLTVTKARIEMNIPKKRTGSSAHDKAGKKFFEALYQAILRHVDFTHVKCVLIGSPGFVAADFLQYAAQESARRDDRPMIENKSKFILCKASSGHKHALEEVFADPKIMAQMSDTKFAKEVEVLNRFMKLMQTDPDRAWYGPQSVIAANEQLAIDALLITDELFRNSHNVQTRKTYVQLVESVRAHGGAVHIFSSMHVSGRQLQQVSGVAAILRFPLPDLDDLEQQAAAASAAATNLEPNMVEAQEEGDPTRTYDTDPNRRLREDLADMGISFS